MIAVILKKVLSFVQVEVTFKAGDMVHIKLYLGDKLVFDREIDIIKGA